MVDAGWKLTTDNFVGDDYHILLPTPAPPRRGMLPAQSGDFLFEGISLPTHANLFPNLSFLNAPGAFTAIAPPPPYMTFRIWRPLAAGKTEIWSWCMVEKDASDEFKQTSYKAYLISFGTSGTLEQNDTGHDLLSAERHDIIHQANGEWRILKRTIYMDQATLGTLNLLILL